MDVLKTHFFFVYVRSNIEYVSIWQYYTRSNKQKIKLIQSKFVSYLTFKETVIYLKFEKCTELTNKYLLQKLYNLQFYLYELLHNGIKLHVPNISYFIVWCDILRQRTNMLSISAIKIMCCLYNSIITSKPTLDILSMNRKILQAFKINYHVL